MFFFLLDQQVNLMVYVNIYNQHKHFIYHKSKKKTIYFSNIKIFNNSSPRFSTDFEVLEMNAMVDDIERVLSNIGQQLKQVNLSYIYE